MQDFLQLTKSNETGEGGAEKGGGASAATKTAAVSQERQVDLRVLLPDRTVTSVTINEYWRTPDVYQVRLVCRPMMLGVSLVPRPRPAFRRLWVLVVSDQ